MASVEVNGNIEEVDSCGGDFLIEIDVAMLCLYVVDQIVQQI